MPQLLLFPDPRPLVERLGADFFRQAPNHPGVYLMRDAADTVLYVGKAKSLRKRLGSYRVANPDRMPRRHLRLLRATVRIELQECADEISALRRESELLRSLKPRFNRAGTWIGQPRYFAWRVGTEGLELLVTESVNSDIEFYSRSLGAGAFPLRTTLARVLWCAIHPDHGFPGMPAGWFRGYSGLNLLIPRKDAGAKEFDEAAKRLASFFVGGASEFVEWIRDCTLSQSSAFEIASREADLEALSEFAQRHTLAQSS